ncbi:glycoside hydrolase family 16 protein [Ceratobasidium sp. AG-Ba]|nr:glycoside hydrolase family 16 protein [Ceratobasidium sp. AG-Ba]
MLSSAIFVTAALAKLASAQTYSVAQEFKGTTFFDGWTFTNGNDAKNWGNVAYLPKEAATSQGLAYVNPAGNAIIKVDNTTVGNPDDMAYGRASVKMNTTQPFTKGSLVVMDALHLPYGCSVWPGYWSQGSPEDAWPAYGEIDIIENVNLAPINQMALHTSQGCTLAPDAQMTGKIVSNDCYNSTNGNQGCIVQMPENSYGQAFAQNGGGVYALEWSSTGKGFQAWFFPRNAIPVDMASAHPDPSTWGTPTAAWPESGCDSSKHFGPQTLIFDISVCGSWAGETSVFQSTCPNQGSCLDLVRNPRNYDTAYFEVAYVRIYSDGSSGGSAGGASLPSGSSTGSAKPTHTSSTGSTNAGSSANDAASVSSHFLTPAASLALGVIAAWFML